MRHTLPDDVDYEDPDNQGDKVEVQDARQYADLVCDPARWNWNQIGGHR